MNFSNAVKNLLFKNLKKNKKVNKFMKKVKILPNIIYISYKFRINSQILVKKIFKVKFNFFH
jgi:hypothetical protein